MYLSDNRTEKASDSVENLHPNSHTYTTSLKYGLFFVKKMYIRLSV